MRIKYNNSSANISNIVVQTWIAKNMYWSPYPPYKSKYIFYISGLFHVLCFQNMHFHLARRKLNRKKQHVSYLGKCVGFWPESSWCSNPFYFLNRTNTLNTSKSLPPITQIVTVSVYILNCKTGKIAIIGSVFHSRRGWRCRGVRILRSQDLLKGGANHWFNTPRFCWHVD